MNQQELDQVAAYGDAKFWAGIFIGACGVMILSFVFLQYYVSDTVIQAMLDTEDLPASLIGITDMLLQAKDFALFGAIFTFIAALYFIYRADQLDRWAVIR